MPSLKSSKSTSSINSSSKPTSLHHHTNHTNHTDPSTHSNSNHLNQPSSPSDSSDQSNPIYLDPQQQARLSRDLEDDHRFGGTHWLPLFLALIPSLGSLFHGESENWTDSLILLLVAFFLYKATKGYFNFTSIFSLVILSWIY